MRDDLISVIVPIYNTKEYLSRCIDSICGQTYGNLEIILVDDGSTDGSSLVCDDYCRKDNRIQVIHKENGGSTAARNAGIAIAKGEYIGFVDSDDWIEADMYECLYNECANNDADISVGRQYLDRGDTSHIEAARSIVEGIITKESKQIAHNIIYSDDYAQKGISPNLWDKLFRRDLIIRHQKNVDERTKFAEDDLCVYAALLDANVVVVLNKPVYHYCQRMESVTNKSDEEYFEKISLFYKQMKTVFDKTDESEVLLQKLNRYMVEFVIRGLNRSFGFNLGVIVPFFIPPYNRLMSINAKNIIVYGAGDVGKDYYYGLPRNGFHVSMWCDARWEELSKLGYEVSGPECIKESEYDTILIATDSERLMADIQKYLIDHIGVDKERIVTELPKTIISSLQ